MAAFPAVKLLALFVRTLAKPVANKMKKEAANHPSFSSLCDFVGQKIHHTTSRANVVAMGYKFVGVKPLPKEEAVAKGVNFLSEVFIFAVAGTVITLETWRSEHHNALKSAANKAKEDEKNAELEKRFRDLEDLVDDLVRSLPEKSQANYHRLRRIRGGEIDNDEPSMESCIKRNSGLDLSWLTKLLGL